VQENIREVSALKVRVKFAKEGAMKFIGHLDTMRYFQKAIRRAKLPIAYSGGFSPHMIMSFAAPLGVGVTSSGEYFDMELTERISSKEMEEALGKAMADEMKVISIREIPDGKASACMSLVAAADYTVRFREGKEPELEWKEKLDEFFHQDSIVIMRKTKRSEKETDIRPWMYQLELRGEDIFMKLSSGSVHNLKPDLVMQAFANYLGIELAPFAVMIHRDEVYADIGDEGMRKLISLENLGKEII
jgi:radical SAM-linked protein